MFPLIESEDTDKWESKMLYESAEKQTKNNKLQWGCIVFLFHAFLQIKYSPTSQTFNINPNML